METESWWIHVQSSSEMFPVAPTPPATPSAQRIDEEIKVGGSGSFNPMMALFSPRSSELADLISPKPEDRVLDCALLLAKLRSDHNVVILSSSVALKIKAMAEVPRNINIIEPLPKFEMCFFFPKKRSLKYVFELKRWHFLMYLNLVCRAWFAKGLGSSGSR